MRSRSAARAWLAVPLPLRLVWTAALAGRPVPWLAGIGVVPLSELAAIAATVVASARAVTVAPSWVALLEP